LIAITRFPHPLNFLVETPVLDFEHSQDFPRIIVVHSFILQEARTIVTLWPIIGKPHPGPAKP